MERSPDVATSNYGAMLGPEGVADAVVNRLRTQFPAKLAQFRNRYNATVMELPDMRDIFDVEQDLRSIDMFPCIFVIETETDGKVSNQQIDMDSFGDEYFFRYRMRAFIWMVGEDTAYVARAIRRYILAVREILLANKILHDSEGQQALVDPETIRESVGDMAVDDAGLRLGMAFVEFEVMTQEAITTYPERPFSHEDPVDISTVPSPMPNLPTLPYQL
jgi:hypothetical protein